MNTLRKLTAGAICCGTVLLGAVAVTADLTGGTTEGRSWSAPTFTADGTHWGFSGRQKDGIHWELNDGVIWD